MEPILITTVQGDFGFDWKFTLTDSQSVVVDLTNATVFFDCQSVSDPAVQFNNAMSIVSAVAGTCKYTVKNTDFVVAGTYSARVVVKYGSGETASFPPGGITIEVEPSLPV